MFYWKQLRFFSLFYFKQRYLYPSADSPGYYVNLSSNPIEKADRYKISKNDTCLNEGPLSWPHKTLHLTINQGLNNSYNLIWDSYSGLQTLTINVYRGPTDSTLTALTNIQGNLNQFVDQFPLIGPNYYII
ncbi:MAG: hypothetical protein SGJ00_07510 [bacterium]|nr:hypothetical protein [bacterium]